MIDTANCALLATDVILDAGVLLEKPRKVTPGEFHALNSLVEAVVLHEKIYVYELPNAAPPRLYQELVKNGVVHDSKSPNVFEKELKARGLEDIANDVLLDRCYGNQVLGYQSEGATTYLKDLVEYEKTLGFARMSSLLETQNKPVVLHLAKLLNFCEEDIILLDDTYRRMRAIGTCAVELDLQLYTGIISRPFLIEYFNRRRFRALQLFDRMKAELDDIDDSDLPAWRRFNLPALTQILLQNCKDSADALPGELLRLREKLSAFRKTLTAQAVQLKTAKTRGEKRKIRVESDRAWDALLGKYDTTTRLSHRIWDIVKEPLKAPAKAIDQLVEIDKADQIILKVQGLTDLWRTLSNAPTIEANAGLMSRVFRVETDGTEWLQIQRLAAELEDIMRRNAEPPPTD